MHQLYISLGSNIGDRMAYLQQALTAIHMQIGDVVVISNVYQTPAWGFESQDFYNACIGVQTPLTTVEVLSKLLAIETDLGRVRNDTDTYTARTVDLDIILSSEGCINTSSLQVPHPRLQERKFVLVPLAEITGTLLHPILQKSIPELLAITPDDAILDRLTARLMLPKKEV